MLWREKVRESNVYKEVKKSGNNKNFICFLLSSCSCYFLEMSGIKYSSPQRQTAPIIFNLFLSYAITRANPHWMFWAWTYNMIVIGSLKGCCKWESISEIRNCNASSQNSGSHLTWPDVAPPCYLTASTPRARIKVQTNKPGESRWCKFSLYIYHAFRFSRLWSIIFKFYNTNCRVLWVLLIS